LILCALLSGCGLDSQVSVRGEPPVATESARPALPVDYGYSRDDELRINQDLLTRLGGCGD